MDYLPIYLLTASALISGAVVYFIEDSVSTGGSKFTKKTCNACGNKGKKREMIGNVFDMSMRVIYYCPDCDEERKKTPEQKKVEFLERERGF